jgi:hypothetical protein
MSFLIFAGAVLGIAAFAVAVNRLTGTRANYLETLPFEAGEKELWRDPEADFARVPHFGRPRGLSFARLRRHTVVWTNRRIIVSQKALFSPKRMITHQIYFATEAGVDARLAAGETFGGFFGRGFETILAAAKSFSLVNDKACVRIKPTEACSARLNLDEALIFSDRLAALEKSLA